MKAIISSTYDSKYLYFLPIVTWCWNRLNVDVICFMPYSDYMGSEAKNQVPAQIIRDTLQRHNLRCELHYFNAPEHKKATYAQCSRLYAACLDLPEDKILVTSDIDMAVFRHSADMVDDKFVVWGIDLVPDGQMPMCYLSAPVKLWRDTFNLNGITYQQALDRLLGDDECQDYRACRWAVDQEQAYLHISKTDRFELPRSNGQNQFAQNRVDRTDTNWRSYLNENLIDAHLWRPGYTDENFANIMELLTMKYPNEDFQWFVDYTESYKKLL